MCVHLLFIGFIITSVSSLCCIASNLNFMRIILAFKNLFRVELSERNKVVSILALCFAIFALFFALMIIVFQIIR